MQAPDRLRLLIDEERARLRAAIPADREGAIRAVVRARDALPRQDGTAAAPDLVTGRRLADLGGNIALQLCLEAAGDAPPASDAALDGWASHFLASCGNLAAAEQVLGHVETGFMRLAAASDDTLTAWIATKRVPTGWRERADFDWWAAWSARQASDSDDRGDARLRRLAYQLGYPPEARIAGCTIGTYTDVFRWLLDHALHGPDLVSERSLVASVASALGIAPGEAADGLDAFTLDRANAAYHAAVPGIAPAPLIRIGPDRLIRSRRGLTTEPLLFLVRELRRRATQEYHNAAHLREEGFRRDLYALFDHRRFVTSGGRVQLRREGGGLRTDVDAVVFDRKTGTLGLFELKSQDPFARSAAELTRQRDNVLYANRQVAGVLAWVQRYGATELLRRVDASVTRTFRAQRVLPFVLGRYLVHFNDGPEPDRRAAWGTWPQLLRLLDSHASFASEGNPLLSIHNRLKADAPPVAVPTALPPREIALGSGRLIVVPSYAEVQASAGH